MIHDTRRCGAAFLLAGLLAFTLASFPLRAADATANAGKDNVQDKAKPKEPEKGEKGEKAEKKTSKPKTHALKKDIFKVEATFKGVFESTAAHEVMLVPKQWNDFKVLKAVAHGTRIKKGVPLIEFDPEKIDEAVRDLKDNVALEKLALEQAAEEIKQLESVGPLKLAAAERASIIAKEDLDLYTKTNRAIMIEGTKRSLKDYEQHVLYYKEELEQLEKMYKEDDLTEETEEIILQRARYRYESINYRFGINKIMVQQALDFALPRMDVQMQEAAKLTAAEFAQASALAPLALNRKKLELEKLKRAQKKNAEKLADLEHDRKLMTVLAPADGLVYFGEIKNGQWSGPAMAEKMLVPEGRAKPGMVLLTVVDTDKLQLRVTIPEADLRHVSAGLEGKARPAGFPDVSCKAQLKDFSLVPAKPGHFDGVFACSLGEAKALIRPGMAAAVKCRPYVNKEALAVPSAAVFSDELDDDKKHVFVWREGKEPDKRSVKVGKKNATHTELLGGVNEGDEILLENPDKNKSEAPKPAAQVKNGKE